MLAIAALALICFGAMASPADRLGLLVYGAPLFGAGLALAWAGSRLEPAADEAPRSPRRPAFGAAAAAFLAALPGLPVTTAVALYGAPIMRDLPRLGLVQQYCVALLLFTTPGMLAIAAVNAYLGIRHGSQGDPDRRGGL